MEAEVKTEKEGKDSGSETEYREEPQMRADGGADAPDCGGGTKNSETTADEPHQRKAESDTQDNRKPQILGSQIKRPSAATVLNAGSASPSPQVMLQRHSQVQQRQRGNKASKTPKQTGKSEHV